MSFHLDFHKHHLKQIFFALTLHYININIDKFYENSLLN